MTDKINNVLRDLFSKLSHPDLKGLEISDHSIQYLKKYTNDSSYFISFYSQVLEKCLRSIKKPVDESVFVDYGGGCGILSFAARLIGFKTVICNDIYEKSLIDAKVISKVTGIPVDHFICGDAEDFVFQMNRLDLRPDHPTNTCDPYTGSWAERLIDLNKLKNIIEACGLEVDITNSFYCYSDNKFLNCLKYLVNLLIKISGPHCLFLSPNITIEIRK